MRAAIITQPGGPEVLQIAERPLPKIKADEILIKVEAAGLNGADIAQRKGKYPAPPGTPQDILGMEVSGYVYECGASVRNWKPGDRVCALIPGGGYAEYVQAHEGSCMPMPGNLNFVETAGLPEAVLTVWHNVFQRGQLKKGERFLVHGGSSGIGTTAIQLARAFKSVVFSTAGSPEKCMVCTGLGADIAINYKEQDFEDVLKNTKVDVILDMVGGDYTPKNIAILNNDGRLVFINSKKGSEMNADILQIMQKRLTITGSTLRNRDNDFKKALASEAVEHVWPLIEQGLFKPIIYQTFPFNEAAEAHKLMESSKHIGKIILKIE
ncbi:zinc-binding dehydrogenase [Pedobacter sp. HMF7647]|uniref:Zinc-binding dehydrogenase n=1 Tax=Hufsiella arboris TaxID=2695275 RepID=A0A7K1YCQ4_9SPHI|nr:NAD(P)H-quinone oxidoreductase [Hufsiella arboris]MXV52367.1 zinc-binding dehydrogenase [Hufsiella arboris]